MSDAVNEAKNTAPTNASTQAPEQVSEQSSKKEPNQTAAQAPGQKPGQAIVVKKKRWRISPIWFLPFTAFLLAIWLAYETYTNRGVMVTIRFNTGSGIAIAKTKVLYKGITIGKVKDVEINQKNIDQVIVTVELDKRTEPYLREDTQFWLVKPSFSLGGISGLDTLVSGNYIAISPGSSGDLKTDYIALKEAPPLGLLGPGLQVELQTNDKGSLVTGSPVYFKKIKVGEVVGSYYFSQDDNVSVLLNIEEEYAHLVKKQSRFYNVSGIRVQAGLSGVNIETESLAAVVMGGIAFYTPAETYLKEAAQRGDKFPLFSSFKEADVGIPIVLHMQNADDIEANITRIQYNGFNIGVIKKITADFNTGQMQALAYINPSAEELLRENSKIWKVEPQIGFNGVSEIGTLIKGIHLEIRPGTGEPSTEFEVLSAPPALPTTAAGLHLNLTAERLGSLKVGSTIYYKNIIIGEVQKYHLEGQSNNTERVKIALHIKPEYSHLIKKNSRFYNSSGISVKGSLTGFALKTESLQTILAGGISVFTPKMTSAQAHNGDEYPLYEDFETTDVGIQIQLYFSDATGLNAGITEVNYKGINIGKVLTLEADSKRQKIKATVNIHPHAKRFLKQTTAFWLVKPKISLQEVSGLGTLVTGNYITLRPGKGTFQGKFNVLNEEPPLAASTPGLHLKIRTQELGSLTAGSPVLYHQLPVGKVVSYKLANNSSQIQINLHIEKKYAHLVKSHSRFYTASGIKISGGITDLTVRTESMSAILKGGIGFITPEQKAKSVKPRNGHSFELFSDLETAQKNTFPISISFKDANGIKVGSLIKYQGITVGEIKRLRFYTDLKQVIADVDMDRVLSSVLGGKSKFWIVKAEFGLASTKNLGTLIAGNYIQVDPIRGKSSKHFRALNEAPHMKITDSGLNLRLKSKRLGSLKIADPVYYRQFKVGQVSGYELANTADFVIIHINIESRYAPLVQQNSKFWNASGINMDINLFAGSKIKTETVQAILDGGISFATPDVETNSQLDKSKKSKKMQRRARQGSVFELHQEVNLKWLEWSPKIPIKS